jgi:diguanylate cyclase (GGDEF)-like protein/PAS domain S-box-containing protein
MAENIRDVFLLLEVATGRILYISPAYEEIWGCSCQSLYSQPQSWAEAVPADERARVLEQYQAGLASGRFEFECRILRPDGAIRWIEMKGFPVLDETGALVRIAGVIEDISQRKQSAQALLDSQQRLDGMVMTAIDAILTVDEERRIVLSNPAAENMFGYGAAELCGQPLDLLLPQRFRPRGEREAAATLSAAVIAAGTRAALRRVSGLRKSGEKFRIEASISKFDSGGRRFYTAILRDVTERELASDKLRESERRFSDMLSNVELLSVMLDRSARIDYCNDYFLNLTGWKREQVLGANFVEMFAPLDLRERLSQLYAAMLDDLPAGRHHENYILTRSGERRLIRWSNSVLRSNLGEVIGIASIGEDCTEQQHAELRIKRLNRVYAVLSEISALIVHVRDREQLFSEACRIVVETGAFRTAWIGTVDAKTQRGKVIAWFGAGEAFVAQIPLTTLEGTADSERPACRALRLGRPVICNDIAGDPSLATLRYELLTRGYKSLACFPLTVAGQPGAVLTLMASECNTFDEQETRLLLDLAGNISFAIDHVEKQERLNYLAYYDELTGLANRSLFLDRVAQYTRSAALSGRKLALGLIDLERFKNINHSLGRSSGDALLRHVAEWLTHNLAEANALARVGADQFAVVLPEIRDEVDLGRLLEQTMEAFAQYPFRLNDSVFHIGAKIGVALYPDDGADADTLFKNAEAALRKAKVAGDRYLFYAQRMTDTVVGRLNLEIQLREAVDKGQFALYYQPKVSLLTGALTGAEALIRWNDPRTGLVLPGQFVPLLEQTGLIHEVGRWVLRRAIQDYLHWRVAGMAAVRIAVNVSPLQLRSRGFIEEIRQAVEVDAHAAAGLELEITESLVMEDVRHSTASLQAIRDMGVSIAIDDFGTGFSSLSYLARLPVDTLKIDRSFVNGMTDGEQGLVLVSTIINLAHSLRLKVVAEGVETTQQSGLLRSLNCDEMQGYLLSKPMPREMFEARYLTATSAA